MSRGGAGPKYPNSMAANGGIGNAISQAVSGVKNWVGEGMPLPGAVKPPAGKTYYRGKLVPSYKKGGIVKKTGLALIHKGEKVTPKEKVLRKMKSEC